MSNPTKAPGQVLALFTTSKGSVIVIPHVTATVWHDDDGEKTLSIYTIDSTPHTFEEDDGEKTYDTGAFEIPEADGVAFLQQLSLYYEVRS